MKREVEFNRVGDGFVGVGKRGGGERQSPEVVGPETELVVGERC